MFYINKENGVVITSIRIDNETKRLIEIVRQHIKAINKDVFTSDNSIAKKTLNLYIRTNELGYLLDENMKKKLNDFHIKSLDKAIESKDPTWKERRNRIDEHINSNVKDVVKEFGKHLQEKGEFDHKPTYNEILRYLIDYYAKDNKDFINPDLLTKMIIREEELRKIRNEKYY